ncbi:MAG: ABC transporter permease [Verrucomicrobiaceae bacterium]|nr:MAG: ABC transporter permease [Verrucomicrobiaceae bacterium]
MTSALILKTGRRGYLFELQRVGIDLMESTARLYVAYSLAKHDIAARYRGSMLGPFWITLTLGATILGIGTLYSKLFHQELTTFLPYMAAGLTAWAFISMIIIEGCDCFVSAASILRQSSLPMFTFVWRTVIRSLMILAHNVIVLICVFAWAGGSYVGVPLALLGLVVVTLILAPVACLVAVGAARFRDIPQIVGAFMQFAMFASPVFWMSSQIDNSHPLLRWNPFYYMLDALRSPLILSSYPSATRYCSPVA